MTHRAFLLALMLLFSVTAARSQTTDRKSPASRLAGAWQVSYEDLALGEVDGTATISPDGRTATVTLRYDHTDYTLTSQSVSEQGDDYTIILTGKSPAAPTLLPEAQTVHQAEEADAASYTTALRMSAPGVNPVPVMRLSLVPPVSPRVSLLPPLYPDLAEQAPEIHITVADDATTIKVSAGDYHGEADFPARHPVETQRVELRLHYYKSGAAGADQGVIGDRLTGTWRYYADPVTWRDAEGKGRVGLFRRDDHNPNFSTQSGTEVWLRPVPPARIQFFAVGVFNFKRIRQLYLGVPTVVEAVFDEPQERDTCPIKVGSLTLTAHRDPDNWRRFVSDPFMPGSDSP